MFFIFNMKTRKNYLSLKRCFLEPREQKIIRQRTSDPPETKGFLAVGFMEPGDAPVIRNNWDSERTNKCVNIISWNVPYLYCTIYCQHNTSCFLHVLDDHPRFRGKVLGFSEGQVLQHQRAWYEAFL